MPDLPPALVIMPACALCCGCRPAFSCAWQSPELPWMPVPSIGSPSPPRLGICARRSCCPLLLLLGLPCAGTLVPCCCCCALCPPALCPQGSSPPLSCHPQESGLKVNQPASFAVSLNGAKGVIDAKVHSPSGALEECHVTEIDQDKYAVRFIPRENGIYSIDVKFNGSHIPGSPFKIRVGEPGQAGDPGMVSAYGPGLEGGTTGSPAEFIVHTTNAGPGALAVTIDGPSKVKMDCQECPEGYKVIYTPMAPGNYLISIKFGGPYHIAGSPFKAKITGARLVGSHSLHETSSVFVDSVPKVNAALQQKVQQGAPPKFASDASRVVAKGLGLNKGFVGQKNSFTVDCSKAGNNMLLVGVHGPKTPCEEILVKHLGSRLYNVSYLLKDKGEYVLVVKWGDEHIPGSPFHVSVP